MRVSTGPRPYRPLGSYRRVGALGELPDYTTFIPASGEKAPFLLGDDSGGWGVLWKDGLQPGSEYVPDFKTKYKYARTQSKAAEDDFIIGSPVRTLQKQLDAKLSDALTRVWTYYQWNTACGIGPHGYWDNCRTPTQYDQLKTALADTRDALNKYPSLEQAMAKVPLNSPTRTDYVPPVDTPAPTTVVTTAPEPTSTVVDKAERRTTAEKYKSSVGTDEKPLWQKVLMYGGPGVIALGLIGALLKKPRSAGAVAGYSRRRRRRRR